MIKRALLPLALLVVACSEPGTSSSSSGTPSVAPPTEDPGPPGEAGDCTVVAPCVFDLAATEDLRFPVTNIAVNGGRLYATAEAENLWSMTTNGDDVHLVAKRTGLVATSLAVTATHTFVGVGIGGIDENRVVAFPRDGSDARGAGSAPDLVSYGTHIVVSGERVFWVSSAGGSQHWFGSFDTNTLTETMRTFSEGGCGSCITADDEFFYFFDRGRLLKGPRDEPRGHGTVELATVQPHWMTSDATSLYLLVGAGVYSLPKTGGELTKIADSPYSLELIENGDWLFWSTNHNVGPSRFMGVKKSGGTPTAFVRGANRGGFAVDDRYLYAGIEKTIVKVAYR